MRLCYGPVCQDNVVGTYTAHLISARISIAARSGKWCAGAAKEPARPRPIGVSCRGFCPPPPVCGIYFFFFNGGFARGASQAAGERKRSGDWEKGNRHACSGRPRQPRGGAACKNTKHKTYSIHSFVRILFRVTVKERDTPRKKHPRNRKLE